MSLQHVLKGQGVVLEKDIQQTVEQQTELQQTDGIRNSNDITSYRQQEDDGDAHHTPPLQGERRARELPPERVAALVTDFSTEFNDGEATRSNLTRAARLFRDANLAEDDFIDVLYVARREAKARTIEKRGKRESEFWPAPPNRMPCFWAVVEDLLSDETGEAADLSR